jgi:hypothetical protein
MSVTELKLILLCSVRFLNSLFQIDFHILKTSPRIYKYVVGCLSGIYIYFDIQRVMSDIIC